MLLKISIHLKLKRNLLEMFSCMDIHKRNKVIVAMDRYHNLLGYIVNLAQFICKVQFYGYIKVRGGHAQYYAYVSCTLSSSMMIGLFKPLISGLLLGPASAR